jgi:hypothetical protein
LNDIGRNSLLGYRKKIAKFLMRTFTCRSTFLYGSASAGLDINLVDHISEALSSHGTRWEFPPE